MENKPTKEQTNKHQGWIPFINGFVAGYGTAAIMAIIIIMFITNAMH